MKEYLQTQLLILKQENDAIINKHPEYKEEIGSAFYQLDKAKLLDEKIRNKIHQYPSAAEQISKEIKNSWWFENKGKKVSDFFSQIETTKVMLLLPVSAADPSTRLLSTEAVSKSSRKGYSR